MPLRANRFLLFFAGETGAVYALVAPTLVWDSGTNDPYPDVTLFLAIDILATDTARLQYATDAGFTTNLVEVTFLVGTVPTSTYELLSALSDGPWYGRSRIERTGFGISAWSNVETKTLDSPPIMTSAAAFNVDENTTLVVTLTATQPSTFAIGGTDAAFFEILDADELNFVDPTDFETPSDSGGNNVYDITITPTAIADSEVGSAQSVAVTVNNVAVGEFTPSDLPDLVLWLEADDLSTLFQSNAGSTAVASDGDLVGFWGDKSSNNFDLNSAADDTTRPTYKTNGGSGSDKPYVSFDGSNDVLRHLASLGSFAAGACSIFVAVRGNPATAARLLAEGRSTDANPVYILQQAGTATASTGGAFVRNDAGTLMANNINLQVGAYDNTDRVYGVIDDGNDYIPYLDGTAGSASSFTRSGSMTLDRTALGALIRTSTVSWWAGRVYAVVVVNRALTSQEISDLTAYLGAKMGLSL